MTSARILVVEDEAIVAAELKERLEEIGYDVPETASTGSQAISLAADTEPDLVLMDIRLAGDMDGIEASRQIHELLDVPVIFLTAYSDEETLGRAKLAFPYGYVVKPIDERSLRSQIEITLPKARGDRILKRDNEWFFQILSCLSDAVVVIDMKGIIRYANPMSEDLTKRDKSGLIGKRASEVITLIDPATDAPTPLLMSVPVLDGRIATQRSVLLTEDGTRRPVTLRVAPMRNRRETTIGVVVVMQSSAPLPSGEIDTVSLGVPN